MNWSTNTSVKTSVHQSQVVNPKKKQKFNNKKNKNNSNDSKRSINDRIDKSKTIDINNKFCMMEKCFVFVIFVKTMVNEKDTHYHMSIMIGLIQVKLTKEIVVFGIKMTNHYSLMIWCWIKIMQHVL